MILIRSLVFQALFYTSTLLLMVLSLPVFVLPARWGWPVVPLWARVNLWLLRWVAGVKVEFRGLENIPQGGCIVAAKHQSAWETFALLPLFRSPTYVLKRELRWIPLFGWYTAKFRQIPVDRGKRSVALAKLTDSARTAIAEGRQILIFPEGTRVEPGEHPDFKPGAAGLYLNMGVPCVPVALNSGVFLKSYCGLKRPGRIVVEFLEPIPPGLDKPDFLRQLHERINTASDALQAEETSR